MGKTVFQGVVQKADAANAELARNIEGAKGAKIQWLDETSFPSTDYGDRSFVSRGETPLREVSGSRFSTNVVTCTTRCGKLRYMMYKEMMNAKVFSTLSQTLKGVRFTWFWITWPYSYNKTRQTGQSPMYFVV